MNGTAAETAVPTTVRRLEGADAADLAAMSGVFEELQYVLRCCEHLVAVLARPEPDPAMVEALWTGALLGYARAFSGRTAVLKDADLAELELDSDPAEFHAMIKKLRDHYASRHNNPRESFTIGAAQANDGRATGVAVVSTPRPQVDDTTVRLLGRIAYALSGLVDGRMQAKQAEVLTAAAALTPTELSRLPLVHLSDEG
jgi:hypothetical protein